MAFDLASVLKDVPELGTNREQIEYIKLDLIDEDPNNFYQLSGIEELAANIELCGLQQPIRVRRHGDGRYIIVSGHRRRAAVALLAKDDPEKWSEVPCIIEADEVSPALQQLRLIFANSSTRTMTTAEISQQAAKVEELLYRLKEEEGYEFPGRMRDHVAQVVGVSKSKLSRLKVIRENLAKCWKKSFEKNNIKEDTAYKLAQMPEQWQKLIYDARKEQTGSSSPYLYSSDVENHERNLKDIEKTKCSIDHSLCSHSDTRKYQAVRSDYLWCVPCTKCCKNCDNLTKCKHSCPKLADLKKQKCAEKQEENRKIKAEKDEADRPYVEQLKSLWERFAECRKESGRTIESVFKSIGRYYSQAEGKSVTAYENGEKKLTRYDSTPFGYAVTLGNVRQIVALADVFDVSLDYLFGRSDVKEMAQDESNVPNSGTIWQTGEPINLGAYVVILGENRFSGMRTAIYQWTGDRWEENGIGHDDDIDGTILGWVPMPEEMP